MKILIPVKSRDGALAPTRKWFRLAAFLFACLMFSQGAGAANAEEDRRVLVAGKDVLKILDGETPRNIPIARGANVSLFDWRALERWGFKERDLPTGSVVANHCQSLREPYVSLALVLLFAQTMLILELLRQRKLERIVSGHLRESEARLREAQSIAQCGSWVWDISRNKTHWSDEMYRILGLVPQSVPPT